MKTQNGTTTERLLEILKAQVQTLTQGANVIEVTEAEEQDMNQFLAKDNSIRTRYLKAANGDATQAMHAYIDARSIPQIAGLFNRAIAKLEKPVAGEGTPSNYIPASNQLNTAPAQPGV